MGKFKIVYDFNFFPEHRVAWDFVVAKDENEAVRVFLEKNKKYNYKKSIIKDVIDLFPKA